MKTTTKKVKKKLTKEEIAQRKHSKAQDKEIAQAMDNDPEANYNMDTAFEDSRTKEQKAPIEYKKGFSAASIGNIHLSSDNKSPIELLELVVRALKTESIQKYLSELKFIVPPIKRNGYLG